MEEFPKQKRQPTLEDQITRFSNRHKDLSLTDYEKILKEQELVFENMSLLTHVKDLKKPSIDLGSDLVDLIKDNKESYLKFLREERKIEARYREEKEAYYNEHFKNIVKNIIEQLEKKEAEEIDGYMTPGTMSYVFKITESNKPYVVKFYDRHENKKEVGHSEVTAMLRAEGIKNVSHLKGYSYEDGVYVMDYIEGKSLPEMTFEEKPKITDEELKTIIETTILLYKRGVVIDTFPKNFIFNSKNKVNIIDYSIEEENLHNTMYYIRDLAIQLSERKKENENMQPTVTNTILADFEHVDELEKRMIEMIERDFTDFAKIFKEDFIKWKNSRGQNV